MSEHYPDAWGTNEEPPSRTIQGAICVHCFSPLPWVGARCSCESTPARPDWANSQWPWIQRQIDMRLKDFASHRATLREGADLIRIDWFKPGTGVMGGTFVWSERHYLWAFGDFHDSVYWSPGRPPGVTGLVGFARSHLDYFAGKCLAASDSGPLGWYPENAEQFIRVDLLDHARNCDRIDDYNRLLPDMLSAAESQGDWTAWFDPYDDDQRDLLGDDAWDWCTNPGLDVAPVVITHWVGLRLAVDQLWGGGREKRHEPA